MNKTYKTFFNRARGMTVVASEVASAVRKGARKAAAVTLLGTQAVTMTLGGMGMPVAHAAPYDITNRGGEVGDSTTSIAIGTGSNASDNSVVIGTNATTGASYATGEVIVGNNVSTSANSSNSVVIGNDISTGIYTGGSVAIGSGASIGKMGTGIAIGYKAKTLNKAADSTFGYDEGDWDTTVAIGSNATADYAGVAIGGGALAAERSVALGDAANASGNSAMAFGSWVRATGDHSMAFGSGSRASGNYSVALGRAEATADNSSALGYYAAASAARSIAFGYGAKAKENATDSIALGSNATANASNAMALGAGANASGANATALGYTATASKMRATALGGFANASGMDATALGYNATASEANATALGSNANATMWSATAVGGFANASEAEATALGYKANASGTGVTAVGYNATAYEDYSVALGYNATASEDYSVALGNNATASGTRSLALGSNATASVNDALALGNNATASSVGTLALGINATASRANALALGSGAIASGENALAFGPSAHATNVGSVGIGTHANATGSNTVAIGDSATAYGEYSTALGYSADALEQYATALGYNANASGSGAIAIGQDAIADLANGVALGSSSKTERNANETGISYTTSGSWSPSSQSNATWKATRAAVSVGNVDSDITRQITGVAAGSKDTDAVNVAQLKTAIDNSRSIVTVNNNSDGNLVVAQNASNPNSYDVQLKTNLELSETGSIQFGDENHQLTADSLKLGTDVALNSNASVGLKVGTSQLSDSTLKVGDKTYIDGNGLNANSKKITNVAAAEADTDAVNYGQLKSYLTDGSAAGGTVTSGDTKLISGNTLYNEVRPANGNYIQQNATTAQNLVALDTQVKERVSYDSTAKTLFDGKSNSVVTELYFNKDATNQVHISSEGIVVGTSSTLMNADGFTAGGHSYEKAPAALMSDGRLKAAGGKFTVDTSGNVVSEGKVTAKGFDASGQKITNVKAGEADTDAVNVAQLRQTTQATVQNDRRIQELAETDRKLSRRINRAGANAAALAALHPQDYDEDHKFSGAVGLGHYRGQQAIAVGMFARPSENLMFSLGSSIAGSKEVMVNAGVSYRFGAPNKLKTLSKAEMAGRINDLNVNNRDLTARLAASEAREENAQKRLANANDRIAKLEADMAKLMKMVAQKPAKAGKAAVRKVKYTK